MGAHLAENTKPQGGCENTPSSINGNMRLDGLPLAMSYLPMQKWENLYDPEVGLSRGTIFCCLDLPFTGKEGKLYGDA